MFNLYHNLKQNKEKTIKAFYRQKGLLSAKENCTTTAKFMLIKPEYVINISKPCSELSGSQNSRAGKHPLKNCLTTKNCAFLFGNKN